MLLRPPHRKRSVASPRKEKEPSECVFFQLVQIPSEGGWREGGSGGGRRDSWLPGAFLCQQLLPHTHSSSAFVSVWGKRNAAETHAARRAERTRAEQNTEWSGCDFSCSHPGARTVLCLYTSSVMRTRAHKCGHMSEARGPGRTRWSYTWSRRTHWHNPLGAFWRH